MALDRQRFENARTRACAALLEARGPAGHWEGELSSSALSTATAVTALAVARRESGTVDATKAGAFDQAIDGGLRWLSEHANADGGWGDTIVSFSNISTTPLCWAAFGAAAAAGLRHRSAVEKAEAWLRERAGGTEPDRIASAIARRYGKDRTFSAPILTMCALAGRLGPGREAWRRVLSLPFELAACPHQWFSALRLPVVSYALPALIAIGQARHAHRPTRNPLARLARNLARQPTLRVLSRIQPGSGGFLEATPLTSFVVMSLAGSGQAAHPVTQRGLAFLEAAQRADGSWPIDTNLATWVTTLSVNALEGELRGPTGQAVAAWLLGQQYRQEHPYTHAAPGGWAWTDLSGGVPDADDTAGALLALKALPPQPAGPAAAALGVQWLLGLQNRDGGIPTFCRGWGALPFDRSSADLTAHALRAWLAWRQELPGELAARLLRAIPRSLGFLRNTQRADGSWLPLWFGNQHAADEANPTHGTSRVLRALADAADQAGRSGGLDGSLIGALALRGARWLIEAQQSDGSWGGAAHTPSSVEETALAVEALASLATVFPDEPPKLPLRAALEQGSQWLVGQIESGQWKRPAPIGFYFARLWYYEKLYPLIFAAGALNRARRALV